MKFKKVRNFRHAWMALYFAVYILWFAIDERLVTGRYTPMHIWLDDRIPFCGYFVIPYVAWYPLLAFVCLYLMLRDEYAFCRYMWTLVIGLSACLAFYIIFPNGQDLRPQNFAPGNFFTGMVGRLYEADSNLNVFPSMHVYGTVAATAAILENKELGSSLPVRLIFVIACVLICLSTVLIKQHSALDLLGGAALYPPIYWMVYKKGRRWRLWTWPALPLGKGKI